MASTTQPGKTSVTVASGPVPSRFRIELHDDLANPELRRQWLQFEDASPVTAFQRLAFVEGLLSHLGDADDVSPIVVAVHEQGRGIVLLTVLVRRHRFGLSVVENLDFDLCDYSVPLTAPERDFSADDMAEIGEAIFDALKPADVIAIKKIRPTIYGHKNPFAFLPDVRPMHASYTTLRLPPKKPSAGGLPPHRPVAFRDAAKKLRRLAKLGTVSFEQAETPSDLAATLDVMVAHRTQRFASLHRSDPLRDSRVDDFYRQLAMRGLEDGSVRVFRLMLDSHLLAVVYTLQHRNTLTILIPSMSPDQTWHSYSPGLVALVKSVEWAQAQGLSHCDLGVGGLGYKSRFGAKEQQLYEVARALSLRGRLAVGEANLRRNYRGLALRFPAIDARIRRALGK